MRLLYLYPEEWTARRAREVHTLSTCIALARAGAEVALVTAGGRVALRAHLRELAGAPSVPGLKAVALSRAMGPIRSASIFALNFRRWVKEQPRFEAGFIIHLKAAEMLRRTGIPYLYEAHEIFAETKQKNEARQRALAARERQAVAGASWRAATSRALAAALSRHYEWPDDFIVVPNAGEPSLPRSVARAEGPLVYAGSIADWKGLELVIDAARAANLPFKIVGGTAEEWRRLGGRCDVRAVSWQPRVALPDLPAALAGARAGLIPTQPESGSGRYSCPMKLFDYARCGLPVVCTALPSLAGLEVGAWCRRVPTPTREGWTEALRDFRFSAEDAEAARLWAAGKTWARRAEKILAELTGTGANPSTKSE